MSAYTNGGFFSKWKKIYDDLRDPAIGMASTKYWRFMLGALANYSKKKNIHFSAAVLTIPAISSFSAAHKNTILQTAKIIRASAGALNLLFYSGNDTLMVLFPNTIKGDARRLIESAVVSIERMEIHNPPPPVKCGYAGFPEDTADTHDIERCIKTALDTASKSEGTNIVGYFGERRKDTRVPVSVPVLYSAAGEIPRLTCSRNINEKGIMISGLPDLALGKEIEISLSPRRGAKNKISVMARAVWNKVCSKTGKMDIGLAFTSVSRAVVRQIKMIVTDTRPKITHF